jgi:hypothetical protein
MKMRDAVARRGIRLSGASESAPGRTGGVTLSKQRFTDLGGGFIAMNADARGEVLRQGCH